MYKYFIKRETRRSKKGSKRENKSVDGRGRNIQFVYFKSFVHHLKRNHRKVFEKSGVWEGISKLGERTTVWKRHEKINLYSRIL